MPREHGRLPAFAGQVCGLVGVHQDLVQDHAALGLDVLGTQGRGADDLAQDIEPQVQVIREQADVEGRVLLRGERVAVAAHLVECLGDGGGGALLRSLEEQVLQEVRRPGQLVGLVTRAAADPVGDSHRPDVRHGLGDQADAAR